jgi:hypothetical protein
MVADTGFRTESACHPGTIVIALIELYELAQEAGSLEVITNIANRFQFFYMGAAVAFRFRSKTKKINILQRFPTECIGPRLS